MSLSRKSNINPKIWGPYFWKTIHFVAHGYPENPNDVDKKTYSTFYENMMKVLPCDKCNISSQELFKKSNIESSLNSKKELIKWAYDFHNSINNKLGKTSPKFDDYMTKFTNQTAGFDYTSMFVNVIILLLILILITIMYFKNC